MPLTGKNYIAGSTSADGSDTFYSVDPRSKTSGDLPFHNATRNEVGRAVNAAVAAFQEMRHYPSRKLADFLDEVALQIESLGDELLHTADRETGLGLPRLTGERGAQPVRSAPLPTCCAKAPTCVPSSIPSSPVSPLSSRCNSQWDQSQSLPPAISLSPSPSPAAIARRRLQPAAQSSSKRTRAIRPPRSVSLRRSTLLSPHRVFPPAPSPCCKAIPLMSVMAG